ncbi:hypothetical protein EVAR_54649_1 [Eumeta japonica]|uniref:Uncharacterized protein n=1 Tax=Eumeta variegata TaxID=151549 RepID=A0A4C1XA24_EUMVA|nr:hypothetical protein EVAR_54649_1 [Eumeta japonica]
MRGYIHVNLRITLEESVLSKLNYRDTVNGPRLLRTLIQRVQNASAKFCFNVPPPCHATPFLSQTEVANRSSRRLLHLAALVFGIMKAITPSHVFEKLSSLLAVSFIWPPPRHRAAAFLGSFKYAATEMRNL